MHTHGAGKVLGVLAAGVAVAVVAAVPALAAGSTWQIVAHPQPSISASGFGSVFTASRSQAWAVGFDDVGGFTISPLIEHWNGTRWAITPGAPGTTSGASLNAVGGSGPADVRAVGQGPNGGLIEHFNGTSWKLVSAGVFREFGSISADSPTDAWAGGTGELASVAALSPTDAWAMSPDGALSGHWNGTAWQAVPTGAGVLLGQDSGGDYPGSPALSGIPGGPLFAVGGASDMSAILEQPHP